MARRIYRFEDRDISRPYSFSQDTKGMPYHGDLRHLFESLRSLIKGEQQGLLDKNGYVIALDGPYGAGKTTAARSLLGELKIAEGDRLHDLYHTFLPFSNPSEAIAVFLNRLAEELWRNRLADIRREIQQFILEVTPENRINASVSLGGLSLSWPIVSSRNSYDGVIDSIILKLSKIKNLSQTIMITLDDLDRLEPNQVVAIMRMVEKLRDLPRVIIILPIYKNVIKDAFTDQLKLDASTGAALLRKLIDYEIKISNRQNDMERVFKKELLKYSKADGLTLGHQDLCWNILLHNIIIAEAYDLISKEKQGGQEKWAILRSSQYLTQLREIFTLHIRGRHRTSTGPYLTHSLNPNDSSKAHWVPLGYTYRSFVEMIDNTDGPAQLSEMRNSENVMKLITTDKDLAEKYKKSEDIGEFSKDVEAKNSEPALTNFFLPILRSQKEESFLTDNYKLRDMTILARHIGGNRKLDTALKDVGSLFDLIRGEYDNFR